MNKDELRIRIIPEDGQVLIETHTDGIVKCKAVQEDALLDCIKNSAMQDYVNSGLLPSDCIHVKIHPNGNKEYCLWYPRLYADISYHETAYPNFPLPRLVFAFHVDTEGIWNWLQRATCISCPCSPVPQTQRAANRMRWKSAMRRIRRCCHF